MWIWDGEHWLQNTTDLGTVLGWALQNTVLDKRVKILQKKESAELQGIVESVENSDRDKDWQWDSLSE